MKNSLSKPDSISEKDMLKNCRLIIRTVISSIRFSILILALLFTFSPEPAKAGLFDRDSPLIEKKLNGEIDWEKGLIRASGTSAAIAGADDLSGNIAVKRLAAMRAAKIDAMRNMLDVLKAVRVDSTTNIESYMISSDFIRNKLHEIIRKAQVIEKKFISDDGLEITIELPMLGSLIETMIPDTGDLAIDAMGTEQECGIIIDASGLGAKPALSPKVLDDSGRELYGASYIKRDYFLSKGLVAYRTKLDDARSGSGAASNPIIIKAIGSTGSGNSDLLISKDDAKRLKTSAANLSCLERGNVIIVLN